MIVECSRCGDRVDVAEAARRYWHQDPQDDGSVCAACVQVEQGLAEDGLEPEPY